MDPSLPPFSSRRCGKAKANAADPTLPPTCARSSSTQEGAPTLSPNFLPQGPPALKRHRSPTVSSLLPIDERFLKKAPSSAYFLNLIHKINEELEIGATTASKESVVMIEMIYKIHKDYRTAIDALSEQIEALTLDVRTLKNAPPQPDTHTPIPFPLPAVAPERATAPDSRPLTLPTAAPPRSMVTIARKGRKEKTTMVAWAAHTPMKLNTINRPQQKKGLTVRKRRLVVKREGEPLPTTALYLRTDIHLAFAAT